MLPLNLVICHSGRVRMKRLELPSRMFLVNSFRTLFDNLDFAIPRLVYILLSSTLNTAQVRPRRHGRTATINVRSPSGPYSRPLIGVRVYRVERGAISIFSTPHRVSSFYLYRLRFTQVRSRRDGRTARLLRGSRNGRIDASAKRRIDVRRAV